MSDLPAHSNLTQIENEQELDAIISAISSLTPDDVMKSEAGSDLDMLSTHTQIESIEASPDGIFWTTPNKKFEAVATIYVVLQYGSMRERDAMSDSYPAYIYGHFDTKSVTIDRITVDTESFYS